MCFPMIKVWNEEMTDFKCGKVFRWILIPTHFCFKCTTKSEIEANQFVLLPSYFYLSLSFRFSSFFYLLFKVVYLLFFSDFSFRFVIVLSFISLLLFCKILSIPNSYPFSFIKRFISCILFLLASLFLGNYSLISLLRFLCFVFLFSLIFFWIILWLLISSSPLTFAECSPFDI